MAGGRYAVEGSAEIRWGFRRTFVHVGFILAEDVPAAGVCSVDVEGAASVDADGSAAACVGGAVGGVGVGFGGVGAAGIGAVVAG